MKFHSRMRSSTCCCLYALLVAPVCTAQQQPPPSSQGTAFVHIRLNTDYDDSEKSLALLNAVARYAPMRQITVAPGDNLDTLFVREYGFGRSDLEKSYRLLLQIILEKNNLARPEDLRPGMLLIPAVPKRTWENWGRNNRLNYVANMLIFRAVSAISAAASANRSPRRGVVDIKEVDPSEVAYKAAAPVGQISPKAPYTMVFLELSVKQVVRLVESKLFPLGTVTAATLPMPVSLADAGNCDSSLPVHDTLKPWQGSRIREILTQASQRSPVLFIMDTGWPNEDAYRESLDTLNGVLVSLWQDKFNLQFPKLQPQANFTQANTDHCRCIERGLRELRALDNGPEPSKRVRVVYLPLTREQNAAPVLTELLVTRTLLDRKTDPNAEITNKEVDDTRKELSDFVEKHFPAKWVGKEVVTDKSILDAVLLIGQAYAKYTQTPFFANESWTVEHSSYGGEYYVEYQTPEYGLVTAATGNDGAPTLLDFAQRCSFTKDTMAVINMTATNVDPRSILMPEDDIDRCLAAGFDGYVTDQEFGTSFAAPRVAWFLAAGEAVRAMPVPLDHWGANLPDVLKSLRDPNATGYLKLFFDPVRYIEAQAGRATPTTP